MVSVAELAAAEQVAELVPVAQDAEQAVEPDSAQVAVSALDAEQVELEPAVQDAEPGVAVAVA